MSRQRFLLACVSLLVLPIVTPTLADSRRSPSRRGRAVRRQVSPELEGGPARRKHWSLTKNRGNSPSPRSGGSIHRTKAPRGRPRTFS